MEKKQLSISAQSLRIQENMEMLEKHTSTPGQGITRLPFTKEIRCCIDSLSQIMRDASLEVREDAAGNIFGRMEGVEKNAPAILIGSHFDSVKFGGNFDGMAGIIVGIEVIRMLRDSGIILKNPVEIMGTHDEEGLRF